MEPEEVVKTHWLLRLALVATLVTAAAEMTFLLSSATDPAIRARAAMMPLGAVAIATFCAASYAIGRPTRSLQIVVGAGILLEATLLGIDRGGCLITGCERACVTAGCPPPQLWASPNDLTSLIAVVVLLILFGAGVFAQFQMQRIDAPAGERAGRTPRVASDSITVAALGFFAGGLLTNVMAFPLEAASTWRPFDTGDRMVARYLAFGLRQAVLVGAITWAVVVLLSPNPITGRFLVGVSLIASASILDLAVSCGWVAAFIAQCSSQPAFPSLRTLEAIGIALPSFLLAMRLVWVQRGGGSVTPPDSVKV